MDTAINNRVLNIQKSFLFNISSVSYCFECKKGSHREIKQMVGSHYLCKFEVCKCGDFCRISCYCPLVRVPRYPAVKITTYSVPLKGYLRILILNVKIFQYQEILGG